MRKLVMGISLFLVGGMLMFASYAYHRPATSNELNLKIQELQTQNATLQRIISIQNKDLERCGFVSTVKHIRN